MPFMLVDPAHPKSLPHKLGCIFALLLLVLTQAQIRAGDGLRAAMAVSLVREVAGSNVQRSAIRERVGQPAGESRTKDGEKAASVDGPLPCLAVRDEQPAVAAQRFWEPAQPRHPRERVAHRCPLSAGPLARAPPPNAWSSRLT